MDAFAPAAPFVSRAAREGRWRLLGAGDAVSIGGEGVYEIIHVSQAKAWLSGLVDGSQRLVDASRLELLTAAEGARRH